MDVPETAPAQPAPPLAQLALPPAQPAFPTEVALAPLRVQTPVKPPPAPPGRGDRPRIVLPLVLFLATCCTTFMAGAVTFVDGGEMAIRAATLPSHDGHLRIDVTINWLAGLTYMACVMSVMLSHEMGHFLQAWRYRIPATLPFFLPMPLPPIGTMGAVIGLRGLQADRKQLFDIGLSGPWAGLALVLPLAIAGVKFAELHQVSDGGLHFGHPLLLTLLTEILKPDIRSGLELQMNPFLMASWVGMLVTGLNMLPVGQLDGGHNTYALFGRRAHWVALAMVGVTIAFIAFAQQFGWILMLTLVLFIGIYHPPTADDTVDLGWPRRVVGLISLWIPVFCLTPYPMYYV